MQADRQSLVALIAANPAAFSTHSFSALTGYRLKRLKIAVFSRQNL